VSRALRCRAGVSWGLFFNVESRENSQTSTYMLEGEYEGMDVSQAQEVKQLRD
jgi:hypothetical protein